MAETNSLADYPVDYCYDLQPIKKDTVSPKPTKKT